LVFLAIVYIATFSTLSLVAHFNFHTHNDLAIHAQVMWNTTQGRWFDTTLLEDRPTNYLGHHFSPALLLLMPLYILWPDAALLLVAQTFILALGVVPIYLYARRVTGSEMVAAALSAAYLLYPALHYTNLFDFHEIVLAVPLLSFTAYWLLTGRYRLFFVFLALSLLVKEEMILVALAFPCYLILVQRKRRLGLMALLLVLLSGFLIIGVAMPALRGDAYFPKGRYDYLGATVGEVARSLVLNPALVFQHLVIPAKIEFLLLLLVPLGLLPLLGLDTLIFALPTVAYLLLSDYEPQYSITYHYASPMIPFLFLAAATGIGRLMRWSGRSLAVAASAFVLAASLASYLLHSPGPLARHFNENNEYAIWPQLRSGYSALAAIPPEAPLMTPEEFAPHLAQREQIYIENENYLPVEYILQETVARTASPRYPALIPDSRGLLYPYSETVFDQDGYWVRRYVESVPISHDVVVSFDDTLTLLAYQWRDDQGRPLAQIVPGAYLDLLVAWRAEGQALERYTFFVHLLDPQFHRLSQVDQEVEGGVYPTDLWEPGMVVADHYRLSVPWGTPPGEYHVLVGAYSSTSGQRLPPTCGACIVRDNALILAPVQVVRPTSQAPPGAVSPQHPLNIRFNSEIELVGFDLGLTSMQPGDTVPLILTWRALADVTDTYAISLVLDQTDGATRLRCLEEPIGLTYPSSGWKRSEVVRDWHDIPVPLDAPPGKHELLLEVRRGDEVIGETSLGHVTVSGRIRQFALPEIEHPTAARIGEGALLLGYDLSSQGIRPGDTLRFTLYWQALEEMPVSYTVFTHLLDKEGQIWGQMDSVPLRGEAPTTSWVTGEIISDQYDIVVDPEAPPGNYVIEIGVYDPSTGQRLPVFANGHSEEGDRLLLEEVKILP
jgi:uncharacterized membrane protein